MSCRLALARRDRRRSARAPFAVILLAGALGIAIGTIGSSAAYFSDERAVTDNELATGTLELNASPASAVIGLSNMAPGDTASGSLVLSNSGTLALRYAMTSTAGNADGKNLRDQLQLTVRTLGSGCGAFDGSQLYSGATSTAAFGNPAAGAQGGDRMLAPGGSETLCLRATLPAGTGDAYQNAATSVTFTFSAEQTANNP
jgi:spore coat-associated protein N